MMDFKINKIAKDDFFKINEEDVMFITNPGRMVIKKLIQNIHIYIWQYRQDG